MCCNVSQDDKDDLVSCPLFLLLLSLLFGNNISPILSELYPVISQSLCDKCAILASSFDNSSQSILLLFVSAILLPCCCSCGVMLWSELITSCNSVVVSGSRSLARD